MDYVDIFDENGLYQNLNLPKKEAKEKGLYHKAVHVWIINPAGFILLQKRSTTRKLFPNKFDISLSQHILTGQTTLIVAVNELKKSYGLDIKTDELEYLYCLRRHSLDNEGNFLGNLFIDTYMLVKDIDIDKLILDNSEMSETRWASLNEIEDISNGRYDNFATRENECKMLIYELKKRKK